MSPTLQPVLARLSAAEKLELVGELWDQLASRSAELPLTAAQQSQLQAERESIRHNPATGSSWPEVQKRILRGEK